MVYYFKALEIDKKSKDIRGQAFCYNSIGIIYEFKGNYDDAMRYYEKSIQLFTQCNYKIGIESVLHNCGIIFTVRGDYKRAIEYYNRSLAIAEELGSKEGIAATLVNIGEVYSFWRKFDEALAYYKKSLALNHEMGRTDAEALIIMNIGSIFDRRGFSDSAFYYMEKAREMYEKINSFEGRAGVYHNLGTLYLNRKEYDKAKTYLHKSEEVLIKTGERRGLGILFISLSEVYASTGDYKKALEYVDKSAEISDRIENRKGQKNVTLAYSFIYFKMEEYEKAFGYLVDYGHWKDSVFNAESTKQFSELRAIYESEKRDKEITLLNNNIELQNLSINNEKSIENRYRIILAFILGGLLVFSAFAVFIIRLNRQKRILNKALAIQNEELMQQKEEIVSQRDEIEAQRDLMTEQRDIANEQKDLIEHQNIEITDSIRYTRGIQNALLGSENDMISYFEDAFIINLPKEIVSGDFYLFSSNERNSVLALGDATGHGVPAAFLCMLGTALLNDIIKQFDMPDKILNEFRRKFIEALERKEGNTEQRDGIDLALVMINHETREIYYSGAKRPVIITRKNGETLVLNPDKMPIGMHRLVDQPFTMKTEKILPGDTLYLFSDGMTDQFDSENKTKMGLERFKSAIEHYSDIPLSDQKSGLIKFYNEWKGDYKQIDDVLVAGVKLNF